MTVSDRGGLSGAILFYMIRRDENQPVRSIPGIPEPMFRLKPKGTLSISAEKIESVMNRQLQHPEPILRKPA